MTNKEQIDFCKELIENIQSHILLRAPDFPEEWTGKQLRTYIAEKASELTRVGSKMTIGERRKYNNDYLINNL